MIVLEITVLDKDLNPFFILDDYVSLIWTDRYNKYGDFEIYASVTDDILNNLKQDYYLKIRNSEHVMIIEGVEITTDAEEGNHITITGRSLESILDRRVVWGQTMVYGALQDGIEILLDDSIIAPSKETRKISNFIFEASTDETIKSLKINAQYTGDNLYDVITGLCEENQIGFKVTLNDQKQFVFSLYRGTDRSYSQSELPYVIFSPNYDNLVSSNYKEDRSGYKNVTLVGGEGEGSARKYIAVGDVSGLDRRELFTDARDISSNVENDQTLSLEEYQELLTQRGKTKLSDCKDSKEFEGEADMSSMFAYGVDYFMGDLIQIEDDYGHKTSSRIIEVINSHNETGTSTYPVLETPEEKGA